MISNQNRRLSITPQGQLIPSPTGNLTLYVDLEIAEERAAKLEAKLVEARNRAHELEVKLEAVEGGIVNDKIRPFEEKDHKARELAKRLGIAIDPKWKAKIKKELLARGYIWRPNEREWRQRDS